MSVDLLIICSHQNIIELGSLRSSVPDTIITLDTNESTYGDQLKQAIYDYLKKMEVKSINTTTNYGTLNLGVLYTENIMFSMKERKKIYELIISYFKFSFIEFIPNPLLYCFGNKISNSIIIDIEYNMIIGTPIYEYQLLDEYICISTRSIQNAKNKDCKFICTLLFGDNNNNANNDNNELVYFTDNYDSSDQSICMMINKLYRILPIDIRKSLTQNVVINGYYKELLLDYSKNMKISFNINSKLGNSLWSCSLVYGVHLMKNKYSFNNSQPLHSYSINKNIETLDWYQTNYIPHNI